ncbi:Putative cell wall binding repeat 2 [Leifsonia sp. CL147]|nr:Putative cell wall binding repeat 2 [Leifsonia sp. CL154]SFL64394.1 Putative cell wall binding repeat 2 [Leifsonia sp. CL147]
MVGSSLVGMLIGSSFSDTCNPAAQDAGQPYSSFLSIKSASGRPSALSTLAGRWEPQIAVEPPVVANAAGTAIAATSSIRGTLPFGGSNHTVTLSPSSKPPITTAVRPDGSWEIPLSGIAPGRYSYSLTAGWGTSNKSTPVSGTLTVIETTRIAGADRWTGSVLASKAAFPTTAPVVYVANGETFPDALSASAAAGMEGGPLLLTPGGSLSDVTRAEIQRLKPSRIVVVGGEAAVASAVSNQLASLASVTRIAGADRFETSRAVAARFPATSVAYLASGLDFPDALSASAAGGARKAPVILIDGRLSTVDQPTLDRIRALKVSSIKLLGGSVAISAGIQTQLSGSFTVGRFAGSVREDTSRLVNDDYFQTAASAYIATSGSFPDALSGGALAARNRSPLYLVPGGCVPAATLQSIAARGATTVITLGGAAVVSEAAKNLASC